MSRSRRGSRRGRIQLIEDLDAETLAGIARLQAREHAGGSPQWLRPWKYWGPRPNILYRALILASILTPRSRRSLLSSLEEGIPPERVRHRMEGLRILFLHGGGGAGPGEAVLLGSKHVIAREYTGAHYIHALGVARHLSRGHEVGECLFNALEASRREAEPLWTPAPGVEVIHILLARRTRRGTCRVPRLVQVVRGSGERIVLDPSEPSGLARLPPTTQLPRDSIEIPCQGLPEEASGLHAYLVEVSSQEGLERSLIYLGDGKGGGLREWLSRSLENLQARLGKRGGFSGPPLYTPRLEYSLELFAANSEARGCGVEARALLASAARTLSLLAGYNPMLARVEPARLDSARPRLPKRPAVLNPYSYRITSSGSLASVGRGTLASYVAPLIESHLGPTESRGVRVECPSPRESPRLEGGPFHLVFAVDPWRPSRLVSRFYERWGRSLAPAWCPWGGGGSWAHVLGDLRASVGLARRGGYVVAVSACSGGGRLSCLERVLSPARIGGLGLRRVYWVPFQRVGSVVEVLAAVYRVGAPSSSLGEVLEPLEWWRRIAGLAGVEGLVRGGLEAVRSSAERILLGL